MAIQFKKAEGTVTKAHKDGSVEEAKTDLGGVKSDKPLSTVNVSMGMTRNLGNYESLKITVGVTMPCEESDLNATYMVAKEWVDARINEVNEEVNASLA